MALLLETANAMRVRRKMMSDDDDEFISAVQMDFRMVHALPYTEVKFRVEASNTG